MKAYGYVRDKFGNFDTGIKKIEQTAKEIGIDVEKIYVEKSDGKFENMNIAKDTITALKNCVLFIPDTSDLYFDEFAMMRFAEKIKENNILLVDCACPKFNNEAVIEDNISENMSDWLFSKMIIILERYMRSSIETENKSREPDIQNIVRKINKMQDLSIQ